MYPAGTQEKPRILSKLVWLEMLLGKTQQDSMTANHFFFFVTPLFKNDILTSAAYSSAGHYSGNVMPQLLLARINVER